MIPVVESAELCAFHMPTPCKMAFCKESHRDPQPTGCRRSRLGESPIPPPTMPLFRAARHGASLPEGAVSAARRTKGRKGIKGRSDFPVTWMVGHVRKANIPPLVLAVSVRSPPVRVGRPTGTL